MPKAGCKKVIDDKISGSRADRPGLDKAPLDTLREGDALVVWKLDRLGRGVKNLVGLVVSRISSCSPRGRGVEAAAIGERC